MQPTADELVPLVDLHDGKNKRNYTKSVVCEFRFPTLLELSGAEPPRSFITALRKSYPTLELGKEVSLNLAEPMRSAHTHILRSKKLSWTITLKKDSVALETNRYTFYSDIRKRVEELLIALKPIIDADYFTRIGLRYVNLIPTDEESQLSEWVNPLLVNITEAGFKGIAESAGRLGLIANDGGCLLQHGLKIKANENLNAEAANVTPDYIIDIDSYREDIAVTNALDVLDKMRHQAYSLFSWSLGPKAQKQLLEGTGKK
jgi:uncharacterized protein (TIGR04255 family)